jgi:hypothetical protein
MPQNLNDTINAFRAAYPEIPEHEIPTAYECFRRYAHLAAEIAQAETRPDLTDTSGGGSVSAGQVDPTRTFTNPG